jgi:AbrB family looped-hinge helix DNA binding protein
MAGTSVKLFSLYGLRADHQNVDFPDNVTLTLTLTISIIRIVRTISGAFWEGEMRRKKVNISCDVSMDKTAASCKVESIISVDERGQMVLPKDLREKAKIKAGDKLAITSWEKGGEICCITLIKVEDLVEMVKGQLGPIIKEIL